MIHARARAPTHKHTAIALDGEKRRLEPNGAFLVEVRVAEIGARLQPRIPTEFAQRGDVLAESNG